MTLLFLLLLPVLIGLFGYLKSGGKLNLKEFLVLEGVVVTVILVGFGIGIFADTADREVWSGSIAKKEVIKTTCTCNCRTVCYGSGKSRSCTTVCDQCPRTHYIATTTNGERAYANMCRFRLSPPPARYQSIVVGEPTAIEHHYTNWLKANKGTILKRTGALEKYADKVPEYPRTFDHYRIDRFLFVGHSDSRQKEWDDHLDELNARIGALKQVNVTVVTTNIDSADYVEAITEKWVGGKKNDFVVVIGTSDLKEVQWVGVVTWSESQDARIAVRDRIMELPEYDGHAILDIIEEEVSAKFVRREMKDFEYLRAGIEPSGRAQLILFIIGTLTSIGLTIWFWREDPFDTL